jgi:hypothetical protein
LARLHGLVDHRQKLAGLDGPELRRIIEDNPVVEELVGLAWEAAARTASDDKRYLLSLDPPHITLLVLIGQKVGRRRRFAPRILRAAPKAGALTKLRNQPRWPPRVVERPGRVDTT